MSRKRDGPSRFLKGFRGYLQADAFSGYDGIYAGGDVVEVGCNAHARRKFIEAQTTDLARAAAALAYYRQLYAIEKAIKAEIAKTAAEDSRRTGAGRDPAAGPPGAGGAGSGALPRVAGGAEAGRAAQEPAGRRDRLHAEQLGGVEAVHQLGLPVDRQQRVRATHEDDRNWTKELVVHRE